MLLTARRDVITGLISLSVILVVYALFKTSLDSTAPSAEISTGKTNTALLDVPKVFPGSTDNAPVPNVLTDSTHSNLPAVEVPPRMVPGIATPIKALPQVVLPVPRVMCTKTQECPFTQVGQAKCHHVYFDIGSNMGVQARKIFEPSKFLSIPGVPDTGYRGPAPALAHFDRVFGVDRGSSVCVIGVEPNYHYHKVLDDTERVYNARGWRTIFLELAVSNVDGENVTFYSDTSKNEDPANVHMGSSLIKWHDDMPGMTVATVDMALFIVNFIKHHDPKGVIMKVDIEGAEYVFMPRMLELEAMCRIDAAFIEWHPQFLGKNLPQGSRTEFHAAFLDKVATQTVVPLSESCPTGSHVIVMEDDETCWNCDWDGGPKDTH